MSVRLQRILASAGVASRRAAEEWIRAGRVRVNGRVARVGDSADPQRDRVEVDGRPVAAGEREFWLVNKPRGVLTTTRDPEGRTTVLDLLPAEARGVRLFPVGRLDKETEGLLLLTNDGEVTQALLHPSRGSEREYRVTVRGRLESDAARRLREGIRLDDGMTAPAGVGPPAYRASRDTTTFTLTMIEGRKRQIRRMLRKLGHPVQELVRTRMGPLHLGRLAPGSARRLRRDELERLREHVQRHGGACS